MRICFSPPLLSVLVLVLLVVGASAQEISLKKTSDFGSNPGNLEMFSYLPPNISEDNFPLVVVLHGCTQSAEEVALQTGWNKLADSLGFSVLYPQTNFSNNISKCFRWFSEKDIGSEEGESASIHQMITHFMASNSVDSNRIFITGLSAGGAMAVAMLARYPELFSAGAIIAGGPYGAAWNIRSAKKAMRGKVKHSPKEWTDLVRSQRPAFSGDYPVISVYHGTHDKMVRPENAGHLIDQWTALHGVDNAPVLVVNNFDDSPHVQLRKYNNHQNETVARWYVLSGVKHELSISTGNAINQGGKTGKYTIDTGFHIPWQCAEDFGLTDRP